MQVLNNLVSYEFLLSIVRAVQDPNNEENNEGSGYGLGGKGSFFGFGRFQELQVGRLAMVGFAVCNLSSTFSLGLFKGQSSLAVSKLSKASLRLICDTLHADLYGV